MSQFNFGLEHWTASSFLCHLFFPRRILNECCGLEVLDWGLRRLENYGASLVEMSLTKFGVPLAGHDAFILPKP